MVPMQTYAEASEAWRAVAPQLEARGIFLPDAKAFMYDDALNSVSQFAADAQPVMVTAASAGAPALFTTLVDPLALQVMTAPNKGAEILGEVRKGSWTDLTAIFIVVEHTGEVTSYGDYAEGGRTGANAIFPQRQSYLYQTIKEYGDREVALYGEATIQWVAEIDRSCAIVMDKFQNLTYHFGVAGLQNYGMMNDPSLQPAITPGLKAAGNGNVWMYNGALNASANEVLLDIQALYAALVAQSDSVIDGLMDADTEMTLVVPPLTSVAITSTNGFGVNVSKILKENFKNIKIVTDALYGVKTLQNPQGLATGNTIQLIAPNASGQQTGYAAYNEKMRAHPVVRQISSWKQKVTGGTWGAVIRQPFAIATMVGA